ncbi:MAG TPA: winged helix-turn-helix domain-containing protein [Thermoplasmata archaeon]
MDTLTRDILRSFQWPRDDVLTCRRPTYWTISRDLKVSPTAVKDRLDELTSSGALREVRAIPDLSFGEMTKTYVVAQVSEKSSERLKQKGPLFDFLEATHHARTYYPRSGDDFASIVVLHRDKAELENRLALVREVVGEFPVLFQASAKRRPVHGELPLLSRKILSVLVKSPFIRVSDLSERVGVSRKTAAKYLDLLVEQRAFYLEPAFESAKMTGALPFAVVGPIEEASRRQIEDDFRRELRENYLVFETHYEGLLVAACWADGFSEVKAFYNRALRIRGIGNPMILVPFETVPNPSVRYD